MMKFRHEVELEEYLQRLEILGDMMIMIRKIMITIDQELKLAEDVNNNLILKTTMRSQRINRLVNKIEGSTRKIEDA